MELYILRHGIAQDGKPGRPDSERVLTSEGKDKLRAVLRLARRSGIEPSLILSSPYARALETAQIAAAELGYKGQIEETRALVPDSSPHDVWDEVRTRKGESAVLLAGHEPLLSAVVALLLSAPALQVDMKKAALVRVDCEHFGQNPQGVLKWMLVPRLAANEGRQ